MPPVSRKPLGIALALARLLLGLLLVAAVIAGLAGTESALRWGAREAERLSEGRLVLHGVHGSLYGPLRIEAIRLETEERRFAVKDVRLDWMPLALLWGHLQVTQLALQELRMTEGQASKQTGQLPESLALPLSLSVPIKVDSVVLESAEAQHVLHSIDLGLEKSADSYRLNLRSLVSEWGRGEGEIKLGERRPFAVSAHISLQQTESLAYRAEADVSGSLQQLRVKATTEVMAGQANITASLMPFADIPLGELRVELQGMNPAMLGKGLPQADLGAVMTLAQKGVDSLEGDIVVENALPGTWDNSRLPLRKMSLHLSGSPGHLALSAIHLDLAGAGDFKGDGQFRDTQLQLDLATANFNPRGAHSKMRRMALAGNIRLQAGAKRQELLADLHDQGFRLHLDARRLDAAVEFREASVQSAAGRLALHGTLDLEGQRQFQLAGALHEFNPADFGDYPAAKVNASLSVAGHLAAEPQATLGFAISDSHFRDQSLSGQGSFDVSAVRIWNSDLLLRLASNRLEVKGALGEARDRLTFRIDADKLSMFDPELAGQVSATGSLAGRFAALSGNFAGQAKDLSWGKKYRIASLQASGRLDQGGDGPLALDANLQGLVAPQLNIDQASLNGQGTRIRHALQFHAKNRRFAVESRVAGGWHDAGWSGQLTQLVNRGPHAFALDAPAKLEVGRQHFLLSDARFDFVGARLALQELAYNAGQVDSRGQFRGLALADLLDLAAQPSALKTDLTLSGDWQFSVRDKVNGHLALNREGGDVSLSDAAQAALGLERLSLSVDARDNRLQGRLEAAGNHLGRLQADAQSMLSRRDGAWGIAGAAPVSGNAELSSESLAWMAPLIDRTGALALDGAVKAKLSAGGTFAQPEVTGSFSGEGFTVALPDQGLRLTEGAFQAELRDQAVNLEKLTARAGEGTLKGQGRLALEGGSPLMQLSLQADKLEVLSRPDRQLILSGTGEASVAAKKLRVVAKLKADKGSIELPKGDAPTLSDDVIVVGRNTVTAKPGPAMGFALDLDLGEHFFVKGRGLDGQVTGALKLTSVDGALPSSRGSIRVVKGTYAAYGQRLEIERGILNFQGPVENPGLNIIALRKNQPVEAGVAVTGTVQSPQVTLVSIPVVPDSEKLSWLVLGHGLQDSSGQEFSALQAAAGALLAAGESVPLEQRIAHAAGLEEVSLKGAGGLESTVLALGKRLSSRAYLSYEQGLGGAGTLVKINYTLTKRLSLRAQAGTANAVDLFYTFSFD